MIIIEKEIKADISSAETDLIELRDRIMSILESALDICEATTAMVYMHKDSVLCRGTFQR